ncbi:MAG: hypothetical protein U9N73_00160 [Candidatus Auribacterota bacterium]|nr:hypothetical protein [Candidatus Auribacterota bacterium]
MRPQDIEKIARGVVGAFNQAGEGSIKAGCGAFSNPEAYNCDAFGCTANYECGEAGNFTCSSNEFSCPEGFFCASDYTG